MKKIPFRTAIFLFILYLLPQTALARTLIPVGRVIGLELKNDTVTVAGFEADSCAKAAGMEEGDRIVSIDNAPITCAADVRTVLERSHGSVALTLERDGKQKNLRLAPAITPTGPKLGIYLKEGVTGIGTVTWYDPEDGSFAALGHGVNTPQGALLKLASGSAYDARVLSVRKGKAGSPGQLMGSITSSAPMATVEQNTPQGVFGKTQTPYTGQSLPVAQPDEIKTGKATILSSVSGQAVQEYSVEILKIYPTTRTCDRNLLIRVTDPALLETTGGIVQGMSGSPIIQNGKLIGAVTHVLVNNPQTGYGIFIENMLDAAA